MRTLADPTRRAIYERIISSREATVGRLTEHAGVSQPAVSQHVKVLLDAHLVVGRKDGRRTFYRADPQALAPLSDWIAGHQRFWEESFDRLGDYLRDLQRNEESP